MEGLDDRVALSAFDAWRLECSVCPNRNGRLHRSGCDDHSMTGHSIALWSWLDGEGRQIVEPLTDLRHVTCVYNFRASSNQPISSKPTRHPDKGMAALLTD
ncbi:hypothetical protein IE4872_PB00103 (plasmid) [Rhizobium gallicum]|uniref:Uncharacterized protein n=2 Tax=Rhizobium gallicum TaxID=56730 RepID=A0A0B4XAD6_9HYPH|nr:hypothetical protein RGR602_PA00137 [Rhizobium gallicum bv. gallicum R602sp]APO69974.1 hypothetical protein IE4872_PB00103 [Rhizobium gallicum]